MNNHPDPVMQNNSDHSGSPQGCFVKGGGLGHHMALLPGPFTMCQAVAYHKIPRKKKQVDLGINPVDSRELGLAAVAADKMLANKALDWFVKENGVGRALGIAGEPTLPVFLGLSAICVLPISII